MFKSIIQFMSKFSASLNLNILWRIIQKLSNYEIKILAWRLIAQEAAHLTFNRNGIFWTVQVQDNVIAQSLFCSGDYQGQEIEKLIQWMDYHGRLTEKHNVIVDIGTTCIPFAKQTNCQILAIEPFPDNYNLLKMNVDQNGLDDRITCVNKAILNQSGIVEMIMYIENMGSAKINRSESGGFEPSNFSYRTAKKILAEPLMGILTESQIATTNVAFVWSDTEGCEGEVIQTGIPLWEAGIPLFVEILPNVLKIQNNISILQTLIPKYFDRFINKAELLKWGEKASIQPVTVLMELIDFLIRKNDGTDVLLLPRR
jgi:FkbM family methyltransferase